VNYFAHCDDERIFRMCEYLTKNILGLLTVVANTAMKFGDKTVIHSELFRLRGRSQFAELTKQLRM